MLTESIYAQILLEDDDTPIGGIAFQGETLEDFLEELANDGDCQTIRTIKDVNKTLIECGIKPVTALPEDHEIIAFAAWDDLLEGFKPDFIHFSYLTLLNVLKDWFIDISQGNEEPYDENTPITKMLHDYQWYFIAIDFPMYSQIKQSTIESNLSDVVKI